MKKYLASLILLFYLSSCDPNAQKNCEISIRNNTAYYIDSVKVTTYGLHTLFTNISPGKQTENKVVIDYKGRDEGTFLLTIYIKDIMKNQVSFGQYKNASNIRKKYSLEIYGDFLIDEKTNFYK